MIVAALKALTRDTLVGVLWMAAREGEGAVEALEHRALDALIRVGEWARKRRHPDNLAEHWRRLGEIGSELEEDDPLPIVELPRTTLCDRCLFLHPEGEECVRAEAWVPGNAASDYEETLNAWQQWARDNVSPGFVPREGLMHDHVKALDRAGAEFDALLGQIASELAEDDPPGGVVASGQAWIHDHVDAMGASVSATCGKCREPRDIWAGRPTDPTAPSQSWCSECDGVHSWAHPCHGGHGKGWTGPEHEDD